MRYLLVLLLSTAAYGALPTINGKNDRSIANMILNPSCAKNDANITDTDSIVSRNTSSPLDAPADCAVDADADTEYAEWTSEDLSADAAYLSGQNCVAKISYSGDASLYEFSAYIGSNKVNSSTMLNASSGARQDILNFPCGDLTDDPTVRVTATDNAAAAINVARVFVGDADNIGSVAQAEVVGTATIPTTASCQWNGSSGSTYSGYSADSDCPTATVTGKASAPATKVPAIRFADGLSAGNYLVQATGAFIGNKGDQANAKCEWSFSDGTNTFGYLNGENTNFNRNGPLVGYLNLDSAVGDTTIEIEYAIHTAGTSSCQLTVDSQNEELQITVIRIPTASEQVFTPDLADLTGFVKSVATSGCAWSTTSASMASFSADADCPDMTVSGNATTPATKIPAFIAPNLLPGRYFVIAGGDFRAEESTSGNQQCSLEIYDGSNSGGISGIIQSPNQGRDATSTVVGQFEYDSTQSNVQFEVRARRDSGNATCVVRGTPNDLTFTLIPLSQGTPAPLLTDSVTLGGGTGLRKVEGSAKLNCDASSAITSNPLSMISSIGNVASGKCDVTLTTGFFNSTPFCSMTNQDTTNPKIIALTVSSATDLDWQSQEDTGSDSSIIQGTLTCWEYR